MSVYLKQFSSHSDYEAYIASEDKVLPNVSICVDTPNEVHYNQVIRVQGVSLNKSELSLVKGDSETLVATVIPSDAGNKSVTWSSSNGSVFTVNSNGLVTAVGDSGNASITVTTVDGGYTAQCAARILDPYVGHEYVEIGGLKWATMNIGANSITDTGLYFQWGDISGYTASQVGSGEGKKYFGWEDYKYGNGTSSPGATGMTKYNSTDGKTVLEASDDAAQANWGGKWRMPTETDFNKLLSATTNTWVTNYGGSGVKGRLFTSKADASKTLFFPACRYCTNGVVSNVGTYGYYWSSSLNSSNFVSGRNLLFLSGSSGKCEVDYSSRCDGFTVRGVIG